MQLYQAAGTKMSTTQEMEASPQEDFTMTREVSVYERGQPSFRWWEIVLYLVLIALMFAASHTAL